MRSLSFFILFILVPNILSAIIIEEQVVVPGHEGQCYDEDGTTFYNEGDVMKSDKSSCIQKNCLGFFSQSGKIRIQTLTCPFTKAGPGFILIQDLNKPYPLCCPQIVRRQSDKDISDCCAKNQKQE